MKRAVLTFTLFCLSALPALASHASSPLSALPLEMHNEIILRVACQSPAALLAHVRSYRAAFQLADRKIITRALACFMDRLGGEQTPLPAGNARPRLLREFARKNREDAAAMLNLIYLHPGEAEGAPFMQDMAVDDAWRSERRALALKRLARATTVDLTFPPLYKRLKPTEGHVAEIGFAVRSPGVTRWLHRMFGEHPHVQNPVVRHVRNDYANDSENEAFWAWLYANPWYQQFVRVVQMPAAAAVGAAGARPARRLPWNLEAVLDDMVHDAQQ